MTHLKNWAQGRLLILSFVLGGIAISQSGCMLAAAGAAGAGAGYLAAKSTDHPKTETVEVHEEHTSVEP